MYLYRYRDNWHDATTIWRDRYEVLRETQCGYWIDDNPQTTAVWLHQIMPVRYGTKMRWGQDQVTEKWVSKTARKRFAYPTEAEALTSFIRRKMRQKKILEAQLVHVQEALCQANRIIDGRLP